jgi:hypothetical protein
VLSARAGATRDRHFLKEDQVANLAGRRTDSMTSGFGMTRAPLRDRKGGEREEAPA